MSEPRTVVVKVEPDLSALRELLHAVDSIKALRELHVDNGHGYCQGCFYASSGYPPYPCSTIALLDAEART